MSLLNSNGQPGPTGFPSRVRPVMNGHAALGGDATATAKRGALSAPHAGGHDDAGAEVEALIGRLLELLGEDAARDGLQKTPHRVAKMYREMLSGYGQDIDTIVNGAMFDVAYGAGEMIVVADIEYQSMCEHHMLPFTGRAHVAYVPRDRVVGLSKIPRLVDMFARRLQIQERLTNEIADSLVTALDPIGAMIVLEGEHTCASLRGVKKHGVNMITTARRGVFAADSTLRDEFYRLIGR
ncbi:MAG: GTP cyclohydrolase I FolE [Ardenticatenales bacterium]